MASSKAPLETIEESRTLANQVANRIRDAILRGAFPSGESLRQEELAAQLGVSRMPVREALRQLEAEGFVVIYPHRGALVVALSADEVREIYDMRIAIETRLLRLALPKMTEETFAQADAIIDQIDQEHEPTRWSQLNWAFHLALYAPAERQRMLSMVKGLHGNVDRYMRIYLAPMKRQQISQQQHRLLVDACRRQDTAEALQILEEHLDSASRTLSAYIEKKGAVEG
jgi:DNA-binding GntR family transcriptional regulator